jgi:uncharacterized protein
MKELIQRVAEELVNNPEQVRVEIREEESGIITARVRVATEDVGKLIGKMGRNAKAFRILVTAAGAKQGKRVRLLIEES